MAYPISNVNVLIDTWESLIIRHNALSRLMNDDVITANTNGANTGNSTVSKTAQLWGTFGANTIVVSTGLRGGNTTNSTPANLPIISNVDVYTATGAAPRVTVGNSTSISIINSTGASFSNTTANVSITTETFSSKNASGNTTVNASAIAVVSASSNVSLTSVGLTAGSVVANQTVVAVGANVVANTTALYIGNSTINVVSSRTITTWSNGSVIANVGVAGFSTGIVNANQTVVAVGANVAVNATTVVVGTTVVNTSHVSTNNFTGADLTLSNNATVAGFANVAGNVVTNGDIIVKGDYSVKVSSNSDIGSNTTANQLIYRFPKASYSSGEITVQIKNGSNTQISKIMLAQNNTSAELTVYGTISSPASGNSSPLLGSFFANLNNANVELLVLQTQANSSVKVVAELIT